MPAVHHKLLLEDALQDSPQVGLCGFFITFKDTTATHEDVTSAEVSLLAQTISCPRCKAVSTGR